MTLSINDMTLSIIMHCHSAVWNKAEGCIVFIVMLNVVMLIVVMPSVIILNVIMLSVIMLSVVAPSKLDRRTYERTSILSSLSPILL